METSERMRSHWWWRPGMRPGRRMLLWHFLVDDQPEVRDLVRAYRDRLAGLPGLDPVPDEWLHMTVQIVGFADEIPAAEVEALAGAVRDLLGDLPPTTVDLGRVLVHDEGVALGVEPRRALDPLREAIRDGVARTVTRHRLDDHPTWTPHISVAYSDGDGPSAPIVAALAEHLEPRPLTIRAAHLVEQVRDGHLYRWETVAVAPLA
ncbi:MAG TPA: 2'-5' RNA ligase family protein [Thermomonospora sp.]|nr:2'-5' RNA ligase family protein [Thermomonospora sp.]